LGRCPCLSGAAACVARSALASLLLATGAAAVAAGPFFVGPYKHASLGVGAGSGLMRSDVDGTLRPVAELMAEDEVLHWAFATGECGDERWGEGIDTARFAQANVQAFVQARRRYVVSTGGEGGQFSCGSDAGFERFIARYDSPFLVGLDLDIEAHQTDADIDALVRRVKAALPRHARLRFSFTLPTHAGSDGSRQGLNRLGERVMRALKRHGLQRAPQVVVNLMVMNYGDAQPAHCVLKRVRGAALHAASERVKEELTASRTGVTAEPVDASTAAPVSGLRCDMGASAAQAARNLHARHRWPLARTAVTAMPGVNDVVSNVTSIDDARRIAADARALGLAGVHHWSLDRDRPCAPPTPAGASNVCSGVEQAPLDFGRAFREGEK
jgi:hypothetical protein